MRETPFMQLGKFPLQIVQRFTPRNYAKLKMKIWMKSMMHWMSGILKLQMNMVCELLIYHGIYVTFSRDILECVYFTTKSNWVWLSLFYLQSCLGHCNNESNGQDNNVEKNAKVDTKFDEGRNKRGCDSNCPKCKALFTINSTQYIDDIQPPSPINTPLESPKSQIFDAEMLDISSALCSKISKVDSWN